MRVVPHDDIEEFVREIMPWIEREPVRYNQIATTMLSVGAPLEREVVLWSVVDERDAIAGLTIAAPPMPMLITDMPAAALEAVAEAAKAQGLRRFHGTRARRLAELVAAGAPISMVRGWALHRLRHVTPPRGVPGHARFGEPADAMPAHEWVLDFQRHIGDHGSAQLSDVDRRIAARDLWLWEDGHRPVSIAVCTEPVHGVVRINLVYTPPETRGHGYASALVAAVSQQILDDGHIPVLYTDLDNPTSNKIYAGLGYERLEEVQLWAVDRE